MVKAVPDYVVDEVSPVVPGGIRGDGATALIIIFRNVRGGKVSPGGWGYVFVAWVPWFWGRLAGGGDPYGLL